MPYSLSDLNRIARVTKYEPSELQNILDGLCSKGLVIDLWTNDRYRYMPSPIMIGIFEFSMMRTGEDVDSKALARLLTNIWPLIMVPSSQGTPRMAKRSPL